MKKNILYSNFQRNLHFTLLLRSLLSILLLFNSVLHMEIITIVNDLFFFFFLSIMAMWSWREHWS